MKVKLTIAALMATGVLCGCSMGMMAEGPNPAQIKQKLAEMPPDKQIEFYKNSPMKADQKAAKIAEIKAKYGLK